jgi:two-component system, NarL family, response regulator NreC
MSVIRILVVDDHAVIRRAICSLLSNDPILDVVCETADGEDAVRKAEELQPDLVLLDISLPGISGIEAARRIRSLSPNSRIIFLSQHDSRQMVEDAVRAGGHGYVAKMDAGSELLKAIRAVREGKRFVSERIVSQGWRAEASW